MCMIYGDQSQEGILLRDYFCCDTNELRLQIHCRPITLEKRLLAYYTQIISGFYPPCYSSCYTHEHLISARCAWQGCCSYISKHIYIYICGCILPPCYSDGQWAIVCDAVLSILGSSSLLIYHSCIVLPELSTRLYLWCTNMPPLHVSDCGWARHEGFVTGGGTCKQETYEDREDEGRKKGSKSLCIQ